MEKNFKIEERARTDSLFLCDVVFIYSFIRKVKYNRIFTSERRDYDCRQSNTSKMNNIADLANENIDYNSFPMYASSCFVDEIIDIIEKCNCIVKDLCYIYYLLNESLLSTQIKKRIIFLCT